MRATWIFFALPISGRERLVVALLWLPTGVGSSTNIVSSGRPVGELSSKEIR